MMDERFEGVWLDTTPVSILGAELSATSAVLRLAGDELLLVSPAPLTDDRRAAVARLGRVAHLYAPNLFHHSWIGDWADAYPEARVHAPEALSKKRPDLRIDRFHGTSEPAFEGRVEELPIEGCRLGETMLFYRPARAMITADLVHNVGRPTHSWAKAYTKMMGFYDRVGLSRALKWTAFSDRAAARASLDRVFEYDFDRLVMGHGEPLEVGAKEAMASTYEWLAA